MLITYFDEVKYEPERQPYYWLAGISLDPSLIRDLERDVGAVAEDCFGKGTLSRDTEFHAADIFNRAGNFKSWKEIDRRLEVLKRLLRILDRHDVICKTYVRIEPARMVKPSEDADEIAFLFLVEKVDQLTRSKDSLGLLIGDFENHKTASAAVEKLSAYRSEGTPYQFGREITSLVDTVHFTHSHLSRMLQLADLYVWTLQLCECGDETKYPQRSLTEFVRSETRILQPHRYKHWPTKDSWLSM